MSSDAFSWLGALRGHALDGEALVEAGRRRRAMSWGALARSVHGVLEALAELGVRRGDVVAALASPSLESAVLIHALLDAGVVLLPLNARHSAHELRDVVSRGAACWVLVGGAELNEPGASASARALAQEVGVGILEVQPASETGVDDALMPPRLVVEQAPTSEREAETAARRVEFADQGIALMLFTSGTSGRPKGAMLTRDNLLASARASARLLDHRATDRWLLCLPIFHIGGLSILVRGLVTGAAVVMHDRFDPEKVDRDLDEEAITSVSFVATMLTRLLATRGERRAPASLRLALLGGGPASAELLERADRLGYPIAPTYGLTEAASQVATRPPTEELPDGADRAGGLRCLPGVEIRIVAEGAERRAAAPGEVGEIEVRGAIVMSGYLDDPAATTAAIRSGWLRTGDLGSLDASGGLRVMDRRSDLIVSGGENIYPAELESLLVRHPDVIEAGVIGVPDPEFGARPVAYLVLREGAVLDPVALSEFCAARLAGYKLPVRFLEMSELPRTASGKLLRRALASVADASLS